MKQPEKYENKFMPAGRSKVIQGSILMPEMGNLRFILVPCSLEGKPSSDLHKVLNKKWRQVGAEVKGWYADQSVFKLGNTHTTAVQSDVWVLHLLCLNKDGQVDQKALSACLNKVSAMAKSEKASVHVSTMSTGEIPELSEMLKEKLLKEGVSVYFYNEQ